MEKDSTSSLFLSAGRLHEKNKKKRWSIFCLNVQLNRVFYRCTNCPADSVLYSCDLTQGFILYCISTHWTITCLRDCKEKSEAVLVLERFPRRICQS